MTGEITNAGGTYTATTNFVLTVISCYEFTNAVTIEELESKEVTMPLIWATSGSYTIT